MTAGGGVADVMSRISEIQNRFGVTAPTAGQPASGQAFGQILAATTGDASMVGGYSAASADGVTGDEVVLVECVFGHGERLVSGLATPDRFVVTADGVVRARVAEKEGSLRLLRTLRDDEALAIADLTRRAESGFGHPVDVEFCFEGRTPWLVQCRAITTLAAAP